MKNRKMKNTGKSVAQEWTQRVDNIFHMCLCQIFHKTLPSKIRLPKPEATKHWGKQNYKIKFTKLQNYLFVNIYKMSTMLDEKLNQSQ